MDGGDLVPDEIVISLLKERITQDDAGEHGWLLDGFPRTEVQAQALKDAEILPDAVLVLNVPDQLLIDRVVGRRLDPETGKIYHVKYNPPNDLDIEARLTRRSDDTKKKARTRLGNYYHHAASIISHYAQRSVKSTVTGARRTSLATWYKYSMLMTVAICLPTTTMII